MIETKMAYILSCGLKRVFFVILMINMAKAFVRKGQGTILGISSLTNAGKDIGNLFWPSFFPEGAIEYLKEGREALGR